MEVKVGLLTANEKTDIDATSQRVISSICETKFSRYVSKAFILISEDYKNTTYTKM